MDYEFDITVTRTKNSEEANELMGELCEEILEHYGDIIESVHWDPRARTQAGLGKNELGEDLVRIHLPRYTMLVSVGHPEPPQYPLDPKEWVYTLIHDINTSLPGFEATNKRWVPVEGLRNSELSNYLGETYEPEVLPEKELHRRREEETEE